MRRSMLYLAITSVAAVGLAACADKDLPTSAKTVGLSSQQSSPPVVFNPPPPRWRATDLVDITAGDNHTCVRQYSGRVYCWGRDDNGQAGISTSALCGGTQCVNRPTQVFAQLASGGSGELIAQQIEAGDNHTCAVDLINDGYCWGDGGVGQVGFGAGLTGPVFTAMPVAGGHKFLMISAGARSTCGIGATGVFCWGVIGGGATVPVSISSYSGVFWIAVGNQHACYLDGTGSGTTYCFGNNSAGQITLPLGNPTSAPFSIQSNFALASGLATQTNFTCANLKNGSVQCAGDNTFGQLGNGTSGGFTSTGTPQLVGGGTILRAVTTGSVHACALDPQGYAYCWGNGFNGQLGNNVSGIFTTPQAVTGGHTYRAIAAGGQHTCAIGTDNHIYCWGQNGFGQLGATSSGGFVLNPMQAHDP